MRLFLTRLTLSYPAEYVVFIAPTPIQNQLYDHVIGSDVVQGYLGGSGKAALAMIDLLKKICNSPALLMRTSDKVSPSLRRSGMSEDADNIVKRRKQPMMILSERH